MKPKTRTATADRATSCAFSDTATVTEVAAPAANTARLDSATSATLTAAPPSDDGGQFAALDSTGGTARPDPATSSPPAGAPLLDSAALEPIATARAVLEEAEQIAELTRDSVKTTLAVAARSRELYRAAIMENASAILEKPTAGLERAAARATAIASRAAGLGKTTATLEKAAIAIIAAATGNRRRRRKTRRAHSLSPEIAATKLARNQPKTPVYQPKSAAQYAAGMEKCAAEIGAMTPAALLCIANAARAKGGIHPPARDAYAAALDRTAALAAGIACAVARAAVVTESVAAHDEVATLTRHAAALVSISNTARARARAADITPAPTDSTAVPDPDTPATLTAAPPSNDSGPSTHHTRTGAKR